jgi:hypothetical protein
MQRQPRLVPVRDERARELERDRALHHEDERQHQDGDEPVGGLVIGPVPDRVAPAERGDAVDALRQRDGGRGRARWRGPGSGPTYQSRVVTIAWVLIAQKSQVSVLRNCGQTS